MTSEVVLREWRKHTRLSYGDRVRHRDGSFATILHRTGVGGYDFQVKFDDGMVSPTYWHCLFPSWWPEQEWPWLHQTQGPTTT